MVRVTSEIGRLRQVLVHQPGPEVDRMVPSMMEELLFDDILFGEEARREHKIFRDLLHHLGVGWLDIQDLLVETLSQPKARETLLRSLFEGLEPGIWQSLEEASAEDVARGLTGGIRVSQQERGLDVQDLFEIPPLPNWCFQRDPQVIVGEGVIFSSMATPARWREVVLARTIFQFHPEYMNVPVYLDPVMPRLDRPLPLGLRRPSFEGGDFLILSSDVIALGFSERTNRTGIRQVARALAAIPEGPRWLIVIGIPHRRAYMHLDTIMTPVDRNACLVFPPVILDQGPQRATVHEIDLRSKDLRPTPKSGVLRALKARGVDLEPIPCGGNDPLHQQREQWTDGANAFALAPGVITMYDRNLRTTEALAKKGFRVATSEDVLAGKADIDLDNPERTCILLPSHEISRARGGPHCLTQPLLRDPV
jgi:arginine deiminase